MIYRPETNASAVPVAVLIESMISGEAPAGYTILSTGMVAIDNDLEIFEQEEMVDEQTDNTEPGVDDEPEDRGRGKRQRVANQLYDGFERH